MSSIEQDDFRAGDDLLATLVAIQWSPAVAGCAVVLETSFLPPGLEADLPDDPVEAAAVVAAHPLREDMRVVAGVLRDGSVYGLARLRSNPDELLGGAALAPKMTKLLRGTLQ